MKQTYVGLRHVTMHLEPFFITNLSLVSIFISNIKEHIRDTRHIMSHVPGHWQGQSSLNIVLKILRTKKIHTGDTRHDMSHVPHHFSPLWPCHLHSWGHSSLNKYQYNFKGLKIIKNNTWDSSPYPFWPFSGPATSISLHKVSVSVSIVIVIKKTYPGSRHDAPNSGPTVSNHMVINPKCALAV